MARKEVFPYKPKYLDFSVSIRAVIAEFMAMTIFVFICCSTAVFFSRIVESSFTTQQATGDAESTADVTRQVSNQIKALQTNGNWGITTALCFGMTIMFLVYTFGHISGGQINCAVTLGLVLAGHLGPLQGFLNFLGQMLGSILGAAFVLGLSPVKKGTGVDISLGQNAVNNAGGFSEAEAFLGEAFMTCVLVFVVLMTVTDTRSISKNMAPFAIGMVVFTAHTVLLPVDGCSINPTRSFGPSVVAGSWPNHWVFWIGPITGAILAVPFYWVFQLPSWKSEGGKNNIDQAVGPGNSAAAGKEEMASAV